MLSEYSIQFDESNMKDNIGDIESFTVGGLLAPIRQWNKFEKEWNRVLREAGVPFFHMTDFKNRKKAYKDWSKDKRDRVLNEFIDIIRGRTILISASISLNNYRFMNSKYPHIEKAYGFCINQCLLQVERYMNKYNLNFPTAYITLAIIKVTSGYKFQTAAYRTDFS
jgi:hypothetical protein